jgi:4-amino-4-deoxy-L-arabinose transferase-like glycosyltransferase
MSLAGFVLFFIAFSFSKYKLPHYLFVMFPFAAVLTADFIVQLKEKWKIRLGNIQFGLMHLFWLLVIVGLVFVFPPKTIWLPVILLSLFIVYWFVFRSVKEGGERIVIPTVIAALAFNLLMSVNFYPHLLNYQAGSQAGKYISENNIPLSRVVQMGGATYSFNFYARDIDSPDTTLNKLKKGDYLFVDEQWLKNVENDHLKYKLIKAFPSFHVTQLNGTFLYEKTRDRALKKRYLIELK